MGGMERLLVPTRLAGSPQEALAGVLGAARACMASPPHVLVFPFPVQGHINCLLHFATGLAAEGLRVTFLHTDYNFRRLGRDPPAPGSPHLRFVSVPDGLPDGHPRSMRGFGELMESLRTKCSVAYRALLASLQAPSADADVFPPVTCVVADGLLPFGTDIPEELGVPANAFRTASACSFLAYLSVPKLLELGQLPFPEGGDLDEPVLGVPGMESYLRRRDLPRQCRNLTTNHDDPMLQTVVAVTAHSRTARALVLNTAVSLESSALAQIAPHMRDVFAVGPLHAMFPEPAAATSLCHEDGGCMAWLDGQEDSSVVYVSLGSLAVITSQQFEELLARLVATGHAFLWVLRPDAVEASGDGDAVSLRVREAIRSPGSGGRACFVAWAPQRDVLRHRAVGCFLTHAGWNSTMEGIVGGLPMVCWPFFADQQINSRFVAAVWRNGLDMKDVCDRVTVESMVREAMQCTEMRRSAQALTEQVRRDIAEGGSSATEFQQLLRFIKELSASPPPCAPGATSLRSKSDNPEW
ncbi:myricetin 3-O-rhamnoside 1,2-glucosyltransferase UGT709G2-like [Miscanthus floridulus]|uniref:myricetin 3-O-rhamnoside 1,2-glucosyltransferase UGT709G2-like n=1 Tax=Miscanthus floridulus TaxID=154761 RepID=UPI00345B3768